MNMQSVAYQAGYLYVGFATSRNFTVLCKYDMAGHLKATTGVLPIRHAASIAVNPSTGHLLVTNGGAATPTKVYVVDFNTKRILKTINLSHLGPCGLSAYDAATHHLWVETAQNNTGRETFSDCTIGGRVLKQFRLTNQGVPQGITVRKGKIYFYTNDKITVISTRGRIMQRIKVSEPGESEGMALLPSGDFICGFETFHPKHTNTLYTIDLDSSGRAFTSTHP